MGLEVEDWEGETGGASPKNKPGGQRPPGARKKGLNQPHNRFLWRLFFERLRRLCLFIFRRRFFLRLPMVW